MNRNRFSVFAAALACSAGLCVPAIGQVTWQTQTLWQVPTPWWNLWNWHGAIDYGSFTHLSFNAAGQPDVAGTFQSGIGGGLCFWARPTGPGTWSVMDTISPLSASGHFAGPLLPGGTAVTANGDLECIAGGRLANSLCFECLGFRKYSVLNGPVLLGEYVTTGNYQAPPRPASAVARAAPGGGVWWLGSSEHGSSGCSFGAVLYYNGTEIHPLGLTINEWSTRSFDMDIGPDGVSTLVAEFKPWCGQGPSGLHFARDPAIHTWTMIAPPEDPGGDRSVRVVTDASGVIHVFGAPYSSSTGLGGPLSRWTSDDNGATWSGPETVLSYLHYNGSYAVAASPTGAVGVAYWACCAPDGGLELRFAENRCGEWTHYAEVGSSGPIAGPGGLKVAYDNQDRPHIAYYEVHAAPGGLVKVTGATTALSAALVDPYPVTICPSAPFAAVVQAAGAGPHAYQWQFRVKGGDWTDLAEGSNDSGNGYGGMFNASGVTTANVSVSGFGDAPEDVPFIPFIDLRCVVSNACESVASDEVTATICPADYNCDGFVSGDDFDAFVAEFEFGTAAADINLDGFTTGEDFDYYVERFMAGC